MVIIPEEEQIIRLVNEYSDMVLRLALAYVHNMADAQDLCQDVFMRIHEKKMAFRDHEHEKAWIIKVTSNRCKDFLRSAWHRKAKPVEDISTHSAWPGQSGSEETNEILDLVKNLPPQYCIVIHLYYLEGYGTREISQILSKNESTIRTQLKRAREQLKNMMSGGQ